MRGIFQRRNIKAVPSQSQANGLSNSSFSSLNNSSVSYAKSPYESYQNSANRACSLDRYANTTAQSQIINQDINKKEINIEFNSLRHDISNSIKILSSPICERQILEDSSKIQLRTNENNTQITEFTYKNQQQSNSIKRENQQQQHRILTQGSSHENLDAKNIHKDFNCEDKQKKDLKSSNISNSRMLMSQQQNQQDQQRNQKFISPVPISNHQLESQIFSENYNYANLMKNQQRSSNQSLHQSSSKLNSEQKGSDITKNQSFDFGNNTKQYGERSLSYQPLKQLDPQDVCLQKNSDKTQKQTFSSSQNENFNAPLKISSTSNQFFNNQSQQKIFQQQSEQNSVNKNTNILRSSSGSTSTQGGTIKNFSFQYNINNKENLIDEGNNYYSYQPQQSCKQNTICSQDESFSVYSQNFECQKSSQIHNRPPINGNQSSSGYLLGPQVSKTEQYLKRQNINGSMCDLQQGLDNFNKQADSKRNEFNQRQRFDSYTEGFNIKSQNFNHKMNGIDNSQEFDVKFKGQDNKFKGNEYILSEQQNKQHLLYAHIGSSDEEQVSNNQTKLKDQNSLYSSNQFKQNNKFEDLEQSFQNIEREKQNSRQSNSYDRMKESEIKELKNVLNDSNQQVKDLLKENRKLNEKYQNVNEELTKTQHKLENLQSHYQELQLKLHTEKAGNQKQNDLQKKQNELQDKYEESLLSNKQLLDRIDKNNEAFLEKISKQEAKYEVQSEKLEVANIKIDQLTAKNTELIISSQKERENLIQMLNELKKKQETEQNENQNLRIELQDGKKYTSEIKYLKVQCEMNETQLKEKHELIESLQRQILDKSKQIDILNISILENMNQIQEIQTDSKRKEIDLKTQNTKLIQENQTLIESIEINRVEKETLNQKLKRLNQNLDEIEQIRAENKDLVQQFKEMYQENEKLLNQIKDKEIHSQQNKQLQSSIDSFKEKNENLIEQNQLISQQLQDATSEIMSLHQQIKFNEKQFKEIQQSYDELKSNSTNQLNESRQKVEEYNDCQEQMKNYKQKYNSLKQRQMIDAEKHQQLINKFQEIEKSYDHLLKEYNEQKSQLQQLLQFKQKFTDQNIKLEELQNIAQQNIQNEQILHNLQSIIQQQEAAINNLNNERQNLLNNSQFKQQIQQLVQENQTLSSKFTDKVKENEYFKMQLMNFNQTDVIVNDLKSKLTHVLSENQRLNQILYDRCKSTWN